MSDHQHTRPLARRAGLAGAVAVLAAGASLLTAPLAQADSAVHTVHGTVRNPDGTPAANVQVRDVGLADVVTTDSNGRYSYTTDAQGRDSACASIAQDDPRGGAPGYVTSCVGFVLSQPSVTANITFTAGAAIGGTVTDARNGAPVSGAKIGFFDDHAEFRSAVTDAYGHWRVRNLDAGVVSTPSVQKGSGVSEAAPYGYEGRDAGGQVTLTAGQARDDANFVLRPLARYSGAVVGADGAAVPGASVAVTDYDDPTAFGTADANGNYTLTVPMSDSVSLCAWGAASKAHPTGLAVSCKRNRSTALTVPARLDVGAEGAAITGRYTVTSGGTPQVTAVVVVPTPTAPLLLPGTVSGRNYTVTSLPAGPQAATLSTDNATAVSRTVQAVAGTTTTVPTVTVSDGGSSAATS